MRCISAFLLVCTLLPSTADAQAHRTYWGISGGFAPTWTDPQSFKSLFGASSVSIEGSEFRIGFVRSSILGGDWGVSFVRKAVKDGSHLTRSISCDFPGCGESLTTSGAVLNGVEVHKFAPFVTIKKRAQIGVNIAGGVGALGGTVHQVLLSPSLFADQDLPAKVLFRPGGYEIDVVPLIKLELAATAILGPDLKLRVSGGLNTPGYQKFSMTLVYLFGAR